MLRDHEEPHGHHVVILPLVVGAGSISTNQSEAGKSKLGCDWSVCIGLKGC